MTRQDFTKYVCEQFKELFGDRYNESKAMETANKLADTYKDKYEEAKEAVKAIVDRTKAKLEMHDSSNKCILKVRMGNDVFCFNSDGTIIVNDKPTDLTFKPDELVNVVVDRVKDKLNYKGEVKAFDVNDLKWIMKLGSKEVTIGSDGHVLVDGVLQSWTIDLRKPFMDIMKELGDHFKGVPTDESLARIKEELHDAPIEVKRAFNSLVEYFDTQYFTGSTGKGKSNKKSWYVAVEVEYNDGWKDWADGFETAETAHEAEEIKKDYLLDRGDVKRVIRIKAFPCEWKPNPRGKLNPSYDMKAVQNWERSK